MMRRISWFMVVVIALAACGDEDPAPGEEDAILTGFDALPKKLATVVLSPTPSPVISGDGAVVDIAGATATPGPPRPTSTKPPFVGVYLGDLAADDDDEPAPTLAPYVLGPGASNPAAANGGGAVVPPGSAAPAAISVDPRFASAYAGVQDRLGAPVSSGAMVQMAAQQFERGTMYWQGSQRQIYALAGDGRLFQVADTWAEGMPADDPALVPPDGRVQPVRGFGKAWRETAALRDALGWGTQSEVSHSGTWQNFERGAMFVGLNGQIYALFTAEGRYAGPL
jgi:hypothetical protein